MELQSDTDGQPFLFPFGPHWGWKPCFRRLSVIVATLAIKVSTDLDLQGSNLTQACMFVQCIEYVGSTQIRFGLSKALKISLYNNVWWRTAWLGEPMFSIHLSSTLTYFDSPWDCSWHLMDVYTSDVWPLPNYAAIITLWDDSFRLA